MSLRVETIPDQALGFLSFGLQEGAADTPDVWLVCEPLELCPPVEE